MFKISNVKIWFLKSNVKNSNVKILKFSFLNFNFLNFMLGHVELGTALCCRVQRVLIYRSA